MNIEKEFYQKIKSNYGECSTVAYNLVRDGVFSVRNMETFLIRMEFKEESEKKNGKGHMQIYYDLAEKYCCSVNKIIYLIHK